MTTNGLYSNEPRPRLCHLRRWPNFTGYGFNLHCDKSKPGQYIGKVDPNSPAESAGLKENDRIIEVNHVPIGNENHKQVVLRIKEGVTRNNTKYPEEVILLVLDPEADAYYKNKSIIVRSTDANVERLETEIRDVTGSNENSPQLSNRSIGKADSPISREISPQTKQNESNRDYKHSTDFTGPTVTQTSKPTHSSFVIESDHSESRPSPSPSDKTKHHLSSNGSAASSTSEKLAVSHLPEPNGKTTPQTSPSHGGTLELKMSAAEYREKLKAQSARKRDPRQEQHMSMKEKHDLIDRL